MKGTVTKVGEVETRPGELHYQVVLDDGSRVDFVAPTTATANDLKPYMLAEAEKAFRGAIVSARFGLDEIAQRLIDAIREADFHFADSDP